MRRSVLNCKSDSERKIPGLSFHTFPYNPNIRKKWIAACGRNEWVPKMSSKICSRHYDADHILKKGRYTYIHPEAVPVMMLGDDEHSKKLSETMSSTSAVIALTTITDSHLVFTDVLQCDTQSVPFHVKKNPNERMTSASTVIPLATITESYPAATDVTHRCTKSLPEKSPEFTPRTLKQKWKNEEKRSKERMKKLRALREKSRRLNKKVANLENIIELKSRSLVSEEDCDLIGSVQEKE